MAKFSILSLMVCLTVVAVCFSGVNQYRQSLRLNEQSERIVALENTSRIQCRISQLLATLDPDDSIDADTQKLVSWILKSVPDNTMEPDRAEAMAIFGTAPQLSDVDGNPGGLEMLALHYNSHTIPGSVGTVIALFDDSKFVDVTTRQGGTRSESHDVRFADANNDGMMDAVIDIQPGFWRAGAPDESIVYIANEFGLRNLADLID